MYLTQQNLQEIVNFLELRTIKDSEFVEATSISEEDYITLVLNGKNVKCRLSALATFLGPSQPIISEKKAWGYTFTVSPALAFYGQSVTALWKVTCNPIEGFTPIIKIDGKEVEKLAIPNISEPTTKTLTIDTNDEGAAKPDPVSATVGVSFSYKTFYYTSKDPTLKELTSSTNIECDDEYIYVVTRESDSSKIAIKYYTLDSYDNGVFEAEGAYVVPAGSFPGLVMDLSGYYLHKSSYALDESWNIKI